MKLHIHSIRWRLLLWQGLISLGLVIAVTVLADRLVSTQKIREIHRELINFDRTFFKNLMQHYGENERSPDNVRRALQELSTGELEPPNVGSGSEYLCVRDKDNQTIYQTPGTPAFLSGIPTLEEGDDFRSHSEGHHWVVLRRHPDGSYTLVGRDISAEQQSILTIRLWLGIGGGAVLLIALAGSWWVAGNSLKPIARISSTAQRIAQGNTGERIEIGEGRSELDGLIRVLNKTFDELAASLDRQKQFTADASHELRTPLAVLLMEVERGLRGGDRTPEAYRQILEHCQSAGTRMSKLVESLLMLARETTQLDTGNWEKVDLAELAQTVVAAHQPLADKRNITIHMNLQTTPVKAHPDQLETLVQNLVANAISHPPAGSGVTVSCFSKNDTQVLEVHDNGPGIPEELQEKVFERFYRVDSARSSGQKHSGLGLAIARSIAHSHAGSLELESSADQGTTFRLILKSTS